MLFIFWFGFISLFNGISPFVGYVMPNISLQNISATMYLIAGEDKERS